MAIIKLSAIERRRVSAFITCLVLAIVAWVFTVLSNPYKYTVKGILNFKNSPQRRAFHPLQSDTVNVIVSGSGWDMLFSRMNAEYRSIPVDLRTLENKSYVVLSSQMESLNNRKDVTQQVSGFAPDTLYFDFSNRKVKRLPVRLVKDVRYQRQFAQSGDILIRPGYVIINGPANVIDNLTDWPSDTLRLDSLGETTTANIKLQPVREGNISLYPKSVEVTIPVDEFTEKSLEIPVKLINNHDYDEIKVFPQKVKVTFTTSLSRYAETTEDSFEATADLDLWRLHGYKVLPVMISKIPKYCRVVKIEPKNIDFIVKK